MIQVIRKSDLIAQVADNWRVANQRRGAWLVRSGMPHPQEVYHALLALPADASEADIAAITGDSRWTENVCQTCRKDQEMIVIFGASEVSHPTDSAYLCLNCLEAAVELAHSLEEMAEPTKVSG